jgi:hypothetical protein
MREKNLDKAMPSRLGATPDKASDNYSYFNAVIGSMCIARRAGK